MNLLGDLDKSDAVAFRKLCDYRWAAGFPVPMPLVFQPDAEIYTNNGIDVESLLHLQSLGLISFQATKPGGVNRTNLPDQFLVSYCGRTLRLTVPEDGNKWFPTGKVLMTSAGSEIASIFEISEIPGFVNYVIDQWKRFNPTEVPITRIQTTTPKHHEQNTLATHSLHPI